jgi:hypothetical protein
MAKEEKEEKAPATTPVKAAAVETDSERIVSWRIKGLYLQITCADGTQHNITIDDSKAREGDTHTPEQDVPSFGRIPRESVENKAEPTKAEPK